MLKSILIFVLLLLFNNSRAQNTIKSYVQNNTYPVLTIEPDSTNYADLESFGTAVGEAQIVMLGEQNHGDAATFLAKSRLVKYLHEKKGFNVLAFESDFFGLTEGWEEVSKTKAGIDSFMYKNPYPIWSWCHTCSNLFYDYIPSAYSKGNPLHVAGFDCQLGGLFSKEHLLPVLEAILAKVKNGDTQAKVNAHLVLRYTDSLMPKWIYKDPLPVKTCISFLENVLQSDEASAFSGFEKLLLKNIVSEMNSSLQPFDNRKSIHYYRDKQMAENILWLLNEKYKGEKLIIWAHSAHVARSDGSEDGGLNEFSMMGHYLANNELLKEKIYVLGFTSYAGANQWANVRAWHQDVETPRKNSFENWINKDYTYAFVDFKPFTRQEANTGIAFYMKGSANPNHQHKNVKNYWARIFDGVFYIKDMFGCNRIRP